MEAPGSGTRHEIPDRPAPALYHGTNHPFGVGDYVEPGHQTHYQGAYDGMEDEALTRVHATPSVEAAWQHADNAVHEHGGQHHVFEVEPTGRVTYGDETFPEDFESDDEMWDKGNRMSTSPFRVVRELRHQGEPLPFTHKLASAAPWTYDTSIVGQVTARSPEGEEHVFHTQGTGLTRIRHHQDVPAALYHGSAQQFAPGDMIEPGHPGNFVSRMTHTYATEQPESDESYKGARGYGGHVYQVEPTGWYGHRRDARGIEWASSHPWRVVREVEAPGQDLLGHF